MALVLADRVQQTGTANTTVSFTLSGSVTGFQSFAVIGNTNTTYYAATDAAGNWESGLGTYSTTGPTLTRTTVYASSNADSAVTFSGTVNVFVTYPSSRSVYEDASGNVSALGTVSSGTWQGSTIGVAYGGTGVTTSSGANSVMLRDANQNVGVNRLNQSNASISAAGGTTALTAASSYSQTLNGTGSQTYTMPDATTLTTGVAFVFNNNATGTLTLQDYATGSIGTITPGGAVELVLLSNGTTAGTWDVHGFLPENVTWGTNALDLGTTIITNGTWQGGTIQSGYGGTGLTTFTGANNALYSTSASALTAGTLPLAAGGTAQTTAQGAMNSFAGAVTSGSYLRGNGTNVVMSTIQAADVPTLNQNTTGTASNVTGTVAIANGGTGLTAAPANGQIDIGNGTGFSRTTLTAGTNITITNGAGSITIASAGGSGVYTSYSSNATVTAGTNALANTSAGSFTLTLPATPSTGNQVLIVDSAGTFGTNNLVVGRNGSTISGIADDLALDISGIAVTLVYNGSTWVVSAQVGATDGLAVTLNGAQTLTNKTLTAPVISTIVNSGTLTLPSSTDTLVGRATTDTLTNKTLTLPAISSISNSGTLTLPAATDTLVGRATTDTLTNKTLTAPVISTISNTGTLTLPTSTDTLVGRDTTDTLTNKTLTNPTVTNYVESVVAIGTVSTASTIALTSGTVQTATLTASTACTFTMPTATAGKSFILLLKQAASTGNGTATFTGVKWGTAGAPTITATAGKMDVLSFVADGTNWYGSITQGFTP